MHKNTVSNLRKNFIKFYDEKNTLKTILIGERILELHEFSNDTETLYFVNDAYNLACAYSSEGKFSKSTELYAKAAEVLEKIQGKTLDYSNIMNNMAIDFNAMGKYKESLNCFKEAYEIREKLLLKENTDYINILFNLGSACLDIENYDEAIMFHEKALSLRSKKDIDYADNLNILGYDYEEKNELDKTIEYLEEGLKIIKRIQGSNSDEYLKNLYYVGYIYEKSGNFVEAKNCYEKSVELIKQNIGEQHPYYAEALNKLANCYLKCGNENTALTLRMKALNIIKNIVGENHLYYASSLKNIGDIYLKKGDFKRAKKMYIEDLEIKEKIIGKESEEYIKDIAILSKVYIQEEEYDKASELLKSCIKEIEDKESIYLENKDLYVSILLDLAYIYAKTYNTKELYEVYKKFEKLEPHLSFDELLEDIKNFEENAKRVIESAEDDNFSDFDNLAKSNSMNFNNEDNIEIMDIDLDDLDDLDIDFSDLDEDLDDPDDPYGFS